MVKNLVSVFGVILTPFGLGPWPRFPRCRAVARHGTGSPAARGQARPSPSDATPAPPASLEVVAGSQWWWCALRRAVVVAPVLGGRTVPAESTTWTTDVCPVVASSSGFTSGGDTSCAAHWRQ